MTGRELLNIANRIEALAFEMKAPNAYTPQFVMMANEVRKLAQGEPEPVAKMREMLEVQGQDGTWNYDPYFHGMYNGMEFMLAMVEDREPVFRSSPGEWLGYTAPPQRDWQGLTDEERDEICLGDEAIARAIEAKLKEKNT